MHRHIHLTQVHLSKADVNCRYMTDLQLVLEVADPHSVGPGDGGNVVHNLQTPT